MEQLNNQVYELDIIKEKLLATYAKYIGQNIPYTDNQLTMAAEQVKNFIDKINNMIIYENGVSRGINNLELFVALYEFVSNRIYVEKTTSHDLIGTLITNEGVCQGYCQLMSFLCELFNIPFLYKYAETFDEDEIYIDAHANFEVIIQDENGFNHCLHCDPTIDSPKDEEDVLGYNAFLIKDTDINKYYHKQKPSGGSYISVFYNNFISAEAFENSISLLTQIDVIERATSRKTDEEIINEHFDTLKNGLIELNNFFGMNIDFNEIEGSSLIDVYKDMWEYYNSISQPFEPEELPRAIINVMTAEIMYEQNIDYDEALLQSKRIYEQRRTKTNSQYEKYWNGFDNKYYLIEEVKGNNGPIIR